MCRVYTISTINSTRYFPTRREADREWSRMVREGEEPEKFDVHEADKLCIHLAAEIEELENRSHSLLLALKGMIDITPHDMRETPESRKAIRLIRQLDPDYPDYEDYLKL